LENAFELVEDRFPAAFLYLIAQVEIDHVSAADAQALLADFEDLSGRDVARDDVAVLGIFFFEEVVALFLRDAVGVARVAGLARPPAPSAFAGGRFGNQPALVFAWNRGGVHLHHPWISERHASLIAARRRAARADHAHRALAEDQSIPAGCHDDGVGAEGFDLHRPHVLGDDAHAPAVSSYRAQEFPELVFLHLALRFRAAGLLIEGIEQLLTGCCTREEGSLEKGSTEETQIALAL